MSARDPSRRLERLENIELAALSDDELTAALLRLDPVNGPRLLEAFDPRSDATVGVADRGAPWPTKRR
jgi:hypothetical protein